MEYQFKIFKGHLVYQRIFLHKIMMKKLNFYGTLKITLVMFQNIEKVSFNEDLQKALNPKSGKSDPKEAFNIVSPKTTKNNFPNVPNFQDFYLKFFQQCHNLNLQILEVFAEGLGVKKDFFVPHHDQEFNTVRLLHYPPSEELIKAGEHSDYGSITLLIQDQVGGLEIFQKDTQKWVPIIPEFPKDQFPIIVNTGDLMELWTNDRFVSTKHRVVRNDINSDQSRYSIACFVHPNVDSTISVIPRKGEKPKYENVNSLDFLNMKLKNSY